MEATMAQERPLPIGAVGAFGRQFRMLWSSRRPVILLVGVLAVLGLAGPPWSDGTLARILQVWPMYVLVLGPIWAFAVFHNEGPSARFYHWSQPVDRRLHTAARLLAGLAWMWIVCALLVASSYLMATIDGNADQLALVQAAGWVNLFTGPTIGFLGVSMITVASDFPVRWFFGIMFLVPIATMFFSEMLGLERALRVMLRPLASEQWGLGMALVGGMAEASARVGEVVIARNSGVSHRHTFDLGGWAWATTLWTLGLAAVVAAIASVHPDRLPRFPRFR